MRQARIGFGSWEASPATRDTIRDSASENGLHFLRCFWYKEACLQQPNPRRRFIVTENLLGTHGGVDVSLLSQGAAGRRPLPGIARRHLSERRGGGYSPAGRCLTAHFLRHHLASQDLSTDGRQVHYDLDVNGTITAFTTSGSLAGGGPLHLLPYHPTAIAADGAGNLSSWFRATHRL